MSSKFLVNLLKDKRASIILVLLFIVLFIFWGFSRYPALMSKTWETIDGKISYHEVLETKEGDSFYKKVWYTTINWFDVNKKWMSLSLCELYDTNF